jgi:hypothetical protein
MTRLRHFAGPFGTVRKPGHPPAAALNLESASRATKRGSLQWGATEKWAVAGSSRGLLFYLLGSSTAYTVTPSRCTPPLLRKVRGADPKRLDQGTFGTDRKGLQTGIRQNLENRPDSRGGQLTSPRHREGGALPGPPWRPERPVLGARRSCLRRSIERLPRGCRAAIHRCAKSESGEFSVWLFAVWIDFFK